MEKRILDLFLYDSKLKFSEIEKLLDVRSNKLAYHVKQLVQKGILKKEWDYYSLSETSECIIPYLSEKRALLPVVLIQIGDKKSCFLHIRKKRPYKDKLSLPGGRIRMDESIPQAVRRVMGEKFNIDAKFRKINSVSLEHVKKSGRTIHSFLLIFVSASTRQKIALTKIEKNKANIIKSDYKLIKSREKRVNINTIYSRV